MFKIFTTFCGILFLIVPLLPAQTQITTHEGQQVSPNYKISPKDVLDVRVFQESDLDGVIRVAGDGTANFPLIGPVKIAGLTVAEANQTVAARFHDGYLVNPQVSIVVRTYAKKFFMILGEVAKSGAYDLEGDDEIPLLQAIAMAGGYTKVANPGKIIVKRVVDGKEMIFQFNAKKIAHGDVQSGAMIHSGDVITVPESIF
jgi:protein involved in polysaccharide export with SLBB domain